jgi:hypothetical protein
MCLLSRFENVTVRPPSIWMAGAGLGIGVFASITLVRLLPSCSHLLYGVGQNDPFTQLGVSAVLLIAAVVACYVPARRAMSIGSDELPSERMNAQINPTTEIARASLKRKSQIARRESSR